MTNFRAILLPAVLLAGLAALQAASRPVVLAGAATRVASRGAAAGAAWVATAATRRPASPRRSPADTVTGCWAGHLRFVPGSPASRRPWRVHRYVGTVGGQPATALLTWQNPDSVRGSFYLHRGGPAYELLPAPHRRGRPVLAVVQENPVDSNRGEWHLTSPLGARLVGTWRSGRQGQPQAVVLRESYAGAARLAIETTHLRGGWANTGERVESCTHLPTVSRDFWRLLAPAAPPALQPLLRPALAARRRATRALRDSEAQVTASLLVKLNDWYLLSYLTYYTTEPFAGHAIEAVHGAPLLDLATGRAWSLGQLLRPGYRAALPRLTARHLLHDPKFRGFAWTWAEKPVSSLANDTAMNHVLWLRRAIVPRPEAYAFTGAGLELTYHPGHLGENQEIADWQITTLIPYAELRPLVRPGTPLARMLRARAVVSCATFTPASREPTR